VALGVITAAACVGTPPKPDATRPPEAFYTVMGEIALSRHEPRVAALQYAAAAAMDTDTGLLRRAAEVAADTLQPSVAETVAARWLSVDPHSLEARRAAARAALALFKIEQAAADYRVVLTTSPHGTDGEFADLETELAGVDDVYAARQLADRLAAAFPASVAARRLQGYAALRADDPAAAVRGFTAAIALQAAAKPGGATAPDGAGNSGGAANSGEAGKAGGSGKPGDAGSSHDADKSGDAGRPSDSDTQADANREVAHALMRARILAGDVDGPLAESKALLDREDTPANRLDYALLLMTAQRDPAALEQLAILARQPEAAPVALRLLGIVEFQDGKLDAAGLRFGELLTTGKFLDDAFYYLGLIAERHADLERALRLYAQVQSCENLVSALIRASSLLQTHGDGAAADQLLDTLVEDVPERAPGILAARARIYSDSGDIPRALQVLDQALLQYPDSVDLRYARASTYDDAGRVADALRELSAILKSRPDDPAAMNALGYTLADHGRHLGRARALIEHAYAAAPKNAAILDSLGWVLFRQGHSAQALPYLSAAYADDRGADIAAHLGEVMWNLGRQADAERTWSEANLADSDNRLLKSTRQRLHALN